MLALSVEQMDPSASEAVWDDHVVKRILYVFCALFLLHHIYHCPHVEAWLGLVLSPWRTKIEVMASGAADFEYGHHDHRDDVSEGDGHLFSSCCPKRRARYWKCAKRRRRRQQASKPSEEKEGDHHCSLSKFYKMHLPPLLPFVRRRHKSIQRKVSRDPESAVIEAVIQEDLKVADESPPSKEEATSSSDTTNKVTLSTTRLPSVPRAHLIDLVRMQQWHAIIQGPTLKRREAKYRDADGLYPLHWAAAGGSPTQALQAILDVYPTAAHKTDGEGSMPLHFAVHYSATLESVNVLLQAYPKAAKHQDKYGRTPLYHAADKSASIDVLKLLAKDDGAAMITMPCFAPKTKSISQEERLTRREAVRTPLYLIWAALLQTRTPQKRGKKWDKAVWMLEASFQHHFSRNDSLLAASIYMDLYLPEQVVFVIAAAHPELLRIPDSLGHLPLSLAASRISYSTARAQSLLEKLCEAYPAAANHRNTNTGRSALFEAIASGQQWSSTSMKLGVLEFLFKAAPKAVEWFDGKTGLPPALLAAQSPISGSIIAVTDADETMTPKEHDPFNLLTTKQHHLIQQQQKNANRAESPCNKNVATAETARLDTLFELLRANPTQILVSP